MCTKKKTTEQFKEEVSQLVGEEYTVSGEYVNNIVKILMIHNSCGTEFLISPVKFLSGQRCPKCSLVERGLKRRTSNEKFKQKVYNLVGDEYSVIGEYTKAKTNIEIRHNKCGHIYEVRPDNFIHGKRCPKCAAQSRIHLQRKDESEFIEQFKKLIGDEYTIVGSYQGTHTKITIQHNICGYRYDVEPNKFLHGRRCPKCAGKTRDTEQFKQEVFELVGNEYKVIGKYKTTATKIKMKHNTCGREYYVTPNGFLGGHRCPHCNESKGERKVYDYLTKNNIDFKREYRINNCRNVRPLPFDFAVFNNNNLALLIEYDGLQHYTESWHGNKLERTKKNDSIRNEYCKQNNIPLLRIPYYDYDKVEKILDQTFINLKIK